MSKNPYEQNQYIEQSLADAAAARAAHAGSRGGPEFPHLQPLPTDASGAIIGAKAGVPTLGRQDMHPVSDAQRKVIHVEGEPLPAAAVAVHVLGHSATAESFRAAQGN